MEINMDTTSEENGQRFKNDFSLPELIFFRGTLYGALFIGMREIFRKNRIAGLLYLLFVIVGFPLLMVKNFCTHCQYPYTFRTCMFFPPELVTELYSQSKEKLTFNEIAKAFGYFGAIALIPQPFLIRNPGMMAFFWLLFGPMLYVVTKRYCNRCRHTDCPFNKVCGTEEDEEEYHLEIELSRN